MSHSSGKKSSGDIFLGALKSIIGGALKIILLIIAFMIHIAAVILEKISETIKHIISK